LNATETPQHDAPLDHLDEKLVHDGAYWTAEGPRGALRLIRWSSAANGMSAWRFPGGRTAHRGKAESIEAARAEALRMAGLIAAGKRG
jgi:hypothetical protein